MKKVILSVLLSLTCIISVLALTNQFSVDTSKFSFSEGSKKQNVLNNFEDDYKLSATISTTDNELEEKIVNLSKKVTSLLLGEINNEDETSEEYFKRHQDYLALRYAPEIPEGDGLFGFDENSQEYKDDLVSGFVVPGMFNLLNELGIVYNSYGNIRVAQSDDMVFSAVTLPNVKMKEEDKKNPMKYNFIETNLTLYYTFKQLEGEYYIYHIIGEYGDEIDDYFTEIDNSETKGVMQIAPTYDSNLKDIYDYSKLDAISENDIADIYNKNKDNIVILNSYYNNYSIASAHGFYINNGLIVTSWNFLEKSLINAQYISITDNNGEFLEMDGIVTANPETDIVVIKLKNKSDKQVLLGDSANLKVEDPIFAISSKTGVSLTVQKGIIVSNDGYIRTSIPLIESDEGSPLIDSNGLVVGINTSKQVNSSISMAVTSNILKEIQDKFSNTNFDDINTISFKELKEKYYYVEYNEEIIKNNIPKNKWNTYKKIGNIEKTISLELVKANYEDGIVSLRYKNDISDYMSSMQLSSSFRKKLVESGYKEILNSNEKYIYQNKKYKVIIMDEFDYLIIVMVKL